MRAAGSLFADRHMAVDNQVDGGVVGAGPGDATAPAPIRLFD
jgi:hypothetical protein